MLSKEIINKSYDFCQWIFLVNYYDVQLVRCTVIIFDLVCVLLVTMI